MKHSEETLLEQNTSNWNAFFTLAVMMGTTWPKSDWYE